MKVILLQELKGKGGEGDVVDVAPGFANNYLFRQDIAIPATKGNLKQLEQRRNNIAKREEVRIASAEQTKAALEGSSVTILAKVGEEGQLFGSVTAAMIADAIQETLGIEIDRKRVELKAPIKTAGTHEVPISLYREIRATVNVVVSSDGEAPAEAAAEAVAEVAAEAATGEIVEAVVETSDAAEFAGAAAAAEEAASVEEAEAPEAAEAIAEVEVAESAESSEVAEEAAAE